MDHSNKRESQGNHAVLYRKDVLDEDDERETSADWEIVSLNAYTGQEPPMRPLTMARNYLHKEGGTQGDFTADQFAEAIWFWSQHATVRPPSLRDILLPWKIALKGLRRFL